MQRGIKADDYEIILIDNGSPEPMSLDSFPTYGAQVSRHYIENASVSPAAAANFGLKQARGRLIGMMVDGARLASPGLLATALLAEKLDERPVICCRIAVPMDDATNCPTIAPLTSRMTATTSCWVCPPA